jgi:hypothetical protein
MPQRRVGLISGGTILEIVPMDDGIDLRVKGGCGRPNCPNCHGNSIEVLTKIVATNYRLQVGDNVAWLGEWLFWKSPRIRIKRLGKYRRIRRTLGG